jgi:pimeloyl-ACP methyl ester carboxylesterase
MPPHPDASPSSLTASQAADLFRRPPTRLLDVGEGQVAYRRVGTGPDVLFVHGWPASGATFRTLLPHLAPHVTCHVLDLVGTGSSTFGPDTPISFDRHTAAVRRSLDLLALDDVAVVAHDSGGLVARHALAGDERVRAWGLIDTEQPQGLTWRFRLFLLAPLLPFFEPVFGKVIGARRLRRSPLLLGDAFHDITLLDGEFDEFFLRPLREDAARRRAAVALLKSFDTSRVAQLSDVHGRIDVPVQLVWGADDPFFPVQRAREMVHGFAHAQLTVIEDASLFCHEERPADVAAALLPLLTGRRGHGANRPARQSR